MCAVTQKITGTNLFQNHSTVLNMAYPAVCDSIFIYYSNICIFIIIYLLFELC